ncbi:acyl-CoA thioesterase [Saccharophagus sp. K07]|uniref:acyl-CoA thioesterase n=1 Tax=Saccharophagus sp. K07 TaxID=2283636 RepID=UPI001652AAD3|nr:thioesterase family protein [Saccharophagus sp. K07]MBC6906696.1 acyl-CoA thioesterase [Saccharophagus sp. K07]
MLQPVAGQKIISETRMQIPFFDVDSLNIVWHGNYCKYFEVARCELLDKIGYDYTTMRDTGFAFPIVEMKIKYILPLRFQQNVLVRVELLEWEHRLKCDYKILDAETLAVHTTATSIQAAVALGDQHLQLVCPSVFTDKVAQYQMKLAEGALQ